DLVDFSSASEIDVIRSNASSLWGNAAGGVVNISSSPGFDAPSLSVQTTFGSFGYRKDLLKLCSRVGPGRLTLSFSNTNCDGWRDHSRSTRGLFQASLKSAMGAQSALAVYLAATSNLFLIPGPLTAAQFDSDPRQAQDDTADYRPTYVQRDERRDNRLGRLGVRFDHILDGHQKLYMTAFVIPKYLQRSERNTFRDFTRYHIGGSAIYQRVNAFSPRFGATTIFGADAAYQDGAILFYNLKSGQRGETIKSDQREGARNLGVFIENQLTLDDRFLTTLGLRFDDITYFYEDHLDPGLNATQSFRHVTPKIAFSYLLGRNHSVYASLGGGVEVPAGNETAPPSTAGLDTLTGLNPLLDPIRSVTVELGTKQAAESDEGSLFTKLSYDVALYWISVRDDIIPYGGGRFYFTAGRTRRIGLEASLAAEIKSGFKLQIAVTQTQNRYMEYLVDSSHYGRPGSFANYAENRVAGVPATFYRFGLLFSPRPIQAIFGECAIQGVSRYYADDANTVAVPQYSIVNISAGLQPIKIHSARITLSAFVSLNNVFDRRYVASAFVNPDRGVLSKTPIYIEPGLPRNWTASLSLSVSL
ncbi:MAG: TonB-dependent receptor, partial [candidate division Zixibacteria bacterium]|nr:TonB-dependent receptor [candidate division Zixibacteria bacterium]